MFNSPVLDVFIGLVFIYLLYSLLAATIQEIIARWFGLRGRMLVKGIRRMLEDQNDKEIIKLDSGSATLAGFIVSTIRSVKRFFNPFIKGKDSFAKAFFTFPSIKYLAENSWNSKPSYIDATTFSQTMVHLLRGSIYDGSSPQMELIRDNLFSSKSFEKNDETKASIDTQTLKHLQRMFYDANGDIDRFKALLEKWFNETMNRASGWYKRQAQLILFIIGIWVAYTFNVDTVAIYNILVKDKKAREEIVQLAINAPQKYKPIIDTLQTKTKRDTAYIKDTIRNLTDTIFIDTTYIDVTDEYLKQTQTALQKDAAEVSNILGLGKPYCDSLTYYKSILDTIGKKDSSYNAIQTRYDKIKAEKNATWFKYSPKQKGGLVTLMGWLLTALAISLGAPFWFDLLNKLIQLRATGPKPKNSTANDNSSNINAPSNSPVNRVG